jgi:protein-S-isoprenylcysteine O-methyltransferase Ste14
MMARGGGWVVAQFALMTATFACAFLPGGWPDGARAPLAVAGAVLAVAGAALAVWSGRLLGRGFTPYPLPSPEGALVERGPFGIVRHPVYAGGLLFFAGFSLVTSVPALVPTGALAVLWALKARVEERLLQARYPAYETYTQRVRWRIAPGLY